MMAESQISGIKFELIPTLEALDLARTGIEVTKANAEVIAARTVSLVTACSVKMVFSFLNRCLKTSRYAIRPDWETSYSQLARLV